MIGGGGGSTIGGICTGGICTGGICTGGICTGGICTGGICTGGICTGGICTLGTCGSWILACGAGGTCGGAFEPTPLWLPPVGAPCCVLPAAMPRSDLEAPEKRLPALARGFVFGRVEIGLASARPLGDERDG